MAKFTLKFPLKYKLFFLLIIIALIPFIVSNAYWYFNARGTIEKNARDNLTTSSNQAVQTLDSILNTKLLGFLSHSQGGALLSNNASIIENDLSNFLLQDPDIQSLSFVDINGQEVVKVARKSEGKKTELENMKDSPAFKVPAFKFGKEYISPVTFSEEGPEITISVPIVYPENTQSLDSFSSVNQIARAPGDVYGVLIGRVSLKKIQETITSTVIGKSGQIFVLSRDGIIFAHRDPGFLGEPLVTKVASSNGISVTPVEPQATTSAYIIKDNTSIPVIRTQSFVPTTQWVVIAEQPISNITADIGEIQRKSLPLFFIPLIFVIALSFMFAYSLTKPINTLINSTSQIGKGNFDYPITVNTGDEIEQLAVAYQDMAHNLKTDRSNLMAERNTLSTVLNTTEEGVIGLDRNFVLLFANKTASKLAGENLQDITQQHLDALFTFLENGTAVTIEQLCESQTHFRKLQIQTSSHEITTVSLIISKVPEQIVSPIRYILTMYDISREQELENMKVDFVSMAAHELRTPLTSIKGYLGLFMEDNREKLDSEQRLLLTRVEESAQRLGMLIDSILKSTRIEKAHVALNYVSTNWVDFLQNIVKEMTPNAQSKSISLTLVKPSHPIPAVFIDSLRMTEVINNLLSNAIKYTQSGGKIVISVELSPTEITTIITDNGQGIPRDSLPNLFTKFYRVPGKLEQTTQGTGLGLYISKQIVELHHGKIWAESELHKGSIFAFSLPLQPPPAVKAPAAPPEK